MAANHEIANERRLKSLEISKRFIAPNFSDVMTNTNNVSFNKGSVLYNNSDESLYLGYGDTLGKIIAENENGIAEINRVDTNEVTSALYGASPDRVVVYVDGVNGEDINTGLTVTEPKKTLVAARNAIGDKTGASIVFIEAGTYVLNGSSNAPDLVYNNTFGNCVYKTDSTIFDPYVVASTHVITSAVNGTVLTGATPTTVVINTPTAPAVAGGKHVRVVGDTELYCILSTVAGVSITVVANTTAPFVGSLDIVNNSVTLELDNIVSKNEITQFENLDIVSSNILSSEDGRLTFSRCTLDINRIDTITNSRVTYNRSVADVTTTLTLQDGALENYAAIYNGNISCFNGLIRSQFGVFNSSITMNSTSTVYLIAAIVNGNINASDTSLNCRGFELNGAASIQECSVLSLNDIVVLNVTDSLRIIGDSTICAHDTSTVTINSVNGTVAGVLSLSSCSKVVINSTSPVTFNSSGAVTSWISVIENSEVCNKSVFALDGGAPAATNTFYVRGGSTVINNVAGEGIVTSANDINMSTGNLAYPGAGVTLVDKDSLAAGAGPTAYTGDFSKYIKL